jgi:hypothetical protein
MEGKMKRQVQVIVIVGLVGVGLAQAQQAQAQQVSDVAKQREWGRVMHLTRLPKAGCFEASYPATAWQEVPCKKPPAVLMVPRKGPRPFTIGNTNDVSAQAPSGTISQAIGSFDSVTGVTSESSPIGNSGGPVNNAYTLQVNTNPLTSTACGGSPNPSCRGWEQFVFFNDGTAGSVFIQYWLLRYNTTCPAGWGQFQFTGQTDIYCVRNATMGAGTPNQPIGNLANLTLSGTANPAGDSVSFSTGTHVYGAAGDNSVAAASAWQFAEFNVFGAGGNSAGGGGATFNSGASIVPRTRIIYGGTGAPLCAAQGFTGETNNLNFGPGTPAVAPPGPAVVFTESTAGGAASNCAAAASIGDTHLATVTGLFYDFQASGDFVLAESEDDFVVQVRQASGAPAWPNAAVNHAVAARLGRTAVAVCLGSGEQGARVYVDGKPIELANGQPRSVTEDVDVGRLGNSYVITDQTGNSVRADVNPTWINVYLGFGHSPGRVRGLIANANDNVNQIAARDGTVLTNPFVFDDLYRRFGDSWRVSDKESLLSPCGTGVTAGAPTRAFYASDLEPKLRQRAQASCANAGVKPGPLLDACVLDVAVLGTELAAAVFATMPPPAAVGTLEGGTGGTGGTVGKGGGGCCRSETTPGSSLAMSLVVLGLLWRRRARRGA